jgi:hypothetical protein
MAISKRRGGAPTKAPGGLDKVLFIRASADLLDALDALVQEERDQRAGRTVSRADVARELLYGAVKKRAVGR